MSEIFRSSRSLMFFKIGILKNVINLTGKHLSCSLFLIKLKVFKLVTLLKRDSNTGAFPVKFAKLLRKPFFTEHLQWLLLDFQDIYFLIINFGKAEYPLIPTDNPKTCRKSFKNIWFLLIASKP